MPLAHYREGPSHADGHDLLSLPRRRERSGIIPHRVCADRDQRIRDGCIRRVVCLQLTMVCECGYEGDLTETPYGLLCQSCEKLARQDEAELKAEHSHFHEQVDSHEEDVP